MRISLLGPVEAVTDEGAPIDLGGARLRRLLIRLALEPGRVVGQDRLIEAVWRDEPPGNAANALQRLVSRLRKAGVAIEAHASGYLLPVPRENIDIFDVDTPRAWRGPVLADVADEPFAQAEIARVTERAVAAREAAAGSVSELEALAAEYPLRERPVLLLMRALWREGRAAEALAAYERLRSTLAEQLGADPSAELSDLHLRILRGESYTARLPAALTSFVGRESEVDRLLHMKARLITLTGPGGSGKTRLAVEAARHFEQVWLIELAPLTDGSQWEPAVLDALGMRKQVPSTVEALAHREGLLILDNCEHMLDAAARFVASVLGGCPGIRVMTTSREPLGITGEVVFPVSPLSTKDAVRLLEDRALHELDQALARRLCEALDGMPLAIELAAARLRTMSLAQLVDRLDERFRLLTGGSRTALPRHQTLRAVVDWSWELCSAAEREAWQRFATFQGGATLEAAEAVCGDFAVVSALVEKSLVRFDGQRYHMLETIREYVDSSPFVGDHARCFLALAEEAEPHLRGHAQAAWLRRLRADQDNLHAALRRAVAASDSDLALRFVAALGWYWWLSGYRGEGSNLAKEALALPGFTDAEVHARALVVGALNLMDGHGDFAQAGKWFSQASELVTAQMSHPLLKLVVPMRSLVAWEAQEMLSVLPSYVELFDDSDPWVAATARSFHGHALLNLGRGREEAHVDFQKALEGYRSVGDSWGMSLALEALSEFEAQRGDFTPAAASARAAIELLSELGTTEDLLQLRWRLAMALWMQGDVEPSVEALRDAQADADELGLPVGQTLMEFAWGALARARGEDAEARRRFDRASQLMSGMSVAPQFWAMLASNRAMVAVDLDSARVLHTEALRHALGSADFPVIGAVLVGCADLSLRENRAELAATLLGAATAMNGAVDQSLPDRARLEAAARRALGAQRFEVAYARGLRTTLDGVQALAGLE
ncbi:BTAD domain-containing putative transcriptional regulator [Allorhizocola rhizosphaerae]|uniref:BTAD domain-containing putative transcriptional regulator n=1 Tax=Allorhizocola rhizosphaerae TaxID=1872709 RepID=UPI000E3BA2C1|nr:BTAD domain-containing putative transcriptional regulator [Allorhizocola rhizosphaerae]